MVKSNQFSININIQKSNPPRKPNLKPYKATQPQNDPPPLTI